ncbi:uncharacterized protein LAESUDRAFT_172954 [Laetiporus sulphureus 93-53]|uniref:Geranylgeranyl pyrophosphate synthetase n=1 Tax=Laetiporus sulphureus 93-53 TaxID=1314785 RepID=A0A165HVZ3_9APHY|nr:uncharacterized protein LAESUDRAFT_172954 [Laetiporus sulphureus 93-53]KZT12264.1 hypothetical protein LAESUDRAFT_172954 [Laetiporus sulphureus 93-53]
MARRRYPRQSGRKPDVDTSFTEGLVSMILKTVLKPDEELMEEADIAISNLEYLGSFNWLASEEPTIAVPGCPPVWRRRDVPFCIPPDSETQAPHRDGNRLPSNPILPWLTAVDIMTEENGTHVDWPSVAFLTDRNSLRKLTRWLQGETFDFRIDTQLIGNQTVVLKNWEKRNLRVLPGTYGMNFEKECTIPSEGLEESVRHHRIVQYTFGGLRMVVCFQVSAYAESQKDNINSVPSGEDGAKCDADGTPERDTLSEMLSQLRLSTSAQSSFTVDRDPSTAELKVIRAGREVPHESLIEIKTTVKDYFQVADAYLQLFLSQTPHVYVGHHRHGTFNKITERHLDSLGESTRRRIKQLRCALQDIQTLVVGQGPDVRLSLVQSKGVLLVFQRRSEEGCLPENMVRRFSTCN